MTPPLTGTAQPVTPYGPGPASRPGWLLVGPALASSLGAFLFTVTIGVVGNAIRSELQLPTSVIPWTYLAYLLPAALAVSVGFLVGRRWPTAVAVSGILLMVLGALFSMLAPGSGTLLFSRAAAGFGAGLVWGVTVVLLTQVGAARRWAAPLAGGLLVLGSVFGLVMGTVIAQSLTWRLPFVLAVPFGAVALLVTGVCGIILLSRGAQRSAQPSAVPPPVVPPSA